MITLCLGFHSAWGHNLYFFILCIWFGHTLHFTWSMKRVTFCIESKAAQGHILHVVTFCHRLNTAENTSKCF